ncbi:MAG: hypothetical protein DIJKHBIC_02333 [Thermoanaerobaculia bacterium]|nr:hypothetical protein [Thermoanaerobaculia bacterium]
MADVPEPLNPEKLDATSAAKDPLNRILRDAIREAVEVHKRMGNPIAIWKDGQVVIVPPEEIDTGEKVAEAGKGA